jgi:hypothetical protein
MFGAIVIIVVLILAIAAAAILVFPTGGDDDDDDDQKGSVVTAEEFCEDWSTISGTFRSWDDGDEVIIRDEIYDIDYVSSSTKWGDVSWTIITFESTGYYVDDFYDSDVPTDALFGMIIFSGDLTGEYRVGDKVDVEIIIVEYEIEGDTAEIPDWYVGIMEAYMGNIEYPEIDFPNIYRISHTQ